MTRIKEFVNNKTVRNGALYTVFSFTNNGINFILLMILAGYLYPDDYGKLQLFGTLTSILSIFITLGTAGYLGVAFFRKTREEFCSIIALALIVGAAIMSLALIANALFPNFISSTLGIPPLFVFLGCVSCYIGVFNSINIDIWRLEERPIAYGAYSLSRCLLNFVVTFIFIVGLKYNWVGRIYASLLVSSIFFLISITFLYKRGYLNFKHLNKAIALDAFAFSIPLLPHHLAFWLKSGMDRYIVNYYYDSAAVGLYSFAFTFAAIINLVGTAFNSNNSVYMFKHLAGGYTQARPTMLRITRLMTFVFIGVLVLVCGGASVIIPFLVPNYIGSVIYLIPSCLGAFFQCMYLLYVNYIFFYKKTRHLMYITFSTAVLQCALSMWLTRYSVLYTAWISCSITALTALCVYIKSQQILRNQLKQESENNIKPEAEVTE